MDDLILVPWSMIWTGFIVSAAGAILSMSGWGQREPRRMDLFGKWVVGIGIVLMLGTPLANLTALGAHMLGDNIKQLQVAMHPQPEEERPYR